MSFSVEGKLILFQGQQRYNEKALHRLGKATTNEQRLKYLVTEFDDLFQEPMSLPPLRQCDHWISLLRGTAPVVVCPYRYPHRQKDEIEKQCNQMLQQGLIQPSKSPFSSPVLLVSKKDGSWCLCIDYHEPNAKTVKDKFPIPVVDELLDELHGAKYFAKLDLRSGYHQVRMSPSDVEKTAFRTHHGHLEFLVMPFGLTNAPSTSQALMNEVFHEFLRHFVLVFFDDILIYSNCWEDHLVHVRKVFLLLRAHRLYLKQYKCCFGTTHVACLGHIISVTGVEVDRSKIQAILDWPQP